MPTPARPRGCSEQLWGAEAEGLTRAGSSLAPVLGLSHCGQKCICGHGNDPSALAWLLLYLVGRALWELHLTHSLCGCDKEGGSPIWLPQSLHILDSGHIQYGVTGQLWGLAVHTPGHLCPIRAETCTHSTVCRDFRRHRGEEGLSGAITAILSPSTGDSAETSLEEHRHLPLCFSGQAKEALEC